MAKIGSRLDSRLPITLPVLNRIIESSAQLTITHYQSLQFRAMCSIALFACLRTREITYNSPKDAHVPLQVHQLSKLLDPSKQVVALKLMFGNFKHNYNQCPFSVILHRHNSCCPVQLQLEYLSLRGNRPGPLFLNSDNCPVSHTHFAELNSFIEGLWARLNAIQRP